MSDSLLPPNSTVIERAMELAAGARIEAVPVPARLMWSPQNAPSQVLPFLAWQFSVDTWDSDWTDDQKRAAIQASYVVHRQKGTIGAVRRALSALGLGLTIVEWWQESPRGMPYTFRIAIDVDQAGAEQGALTKILEVVNTSKNLRSHLNSVDLQVKTSGAEYFAAAAVIGHEITINFEI